jgi:hypothetical protein
MKKTNGINRRQFMRRSLIASAGVMASLKGFSQKPQVKKSDMKVGLYGITLLGIWFSGKGATLEEQIKLAKKFGYDGVEIEGKRPHGNPLDWPAKRCKELRTIAINEGTTCMESLLIMISAVRCLNSVKVRSRTLKIL